MLVFNLFSFSFWSTTGCFSTSVNFNFWRRSRMKCIFEIAGALNASKCCVFCAKTSRQGMSRKERCQERNVTGKRCHGKEVCQEKAASRKNKVSGKEMSTERAVWRKRHVSQMRQGKEMPGRGSFNSCLASNSWRCFLAAPMLQRHWGSSWSPWLLRQHGSTFHLHSPSQVFQVESREQNLPGSCHCSCPAQRLLKIQPENAKPMALCTWPSTQPGSSGLRGMQPQMLQFSVVFLGRKCHRCPWYCCFFLRWG